MWSTSRPSTVNSSPNATRAPSRHKPPKVGSPNSKTSYPPHVKACAGSSKPKTAHHDTHLCSDSRTQPHTPTCLTCPTLEKSSDQHFFRKNTDNRGLPFDQPRRPPRGHPGPARSRVDRDDRPLRP